MGNRLVDMFKNGEVSVDKIDDSAVRNMWPFFEMGLFDNPNLNTQDNDVTTTEHNALARELASKSTVLLQNDGVLPILDVKNIVVVGDQAQNPTVHGGGSGSVSPKYVSTPLDSIQSRFAGINNCS